MTEYVVIYERNDDGWWAYLPDLPGCTAAGRDRDEAERSIRTAATNHVDLLRSTGRPVPEPIASGAGHVAV